MEAALALVQGPALGPLDDQGPHLRPSLSVAEDHLLAESVSDLLKDLAGNPLLHGGSPLREGSTLRTLEHEGV